jgi:bifunctional isochorismate lyase/aryl carrier protein
MTIPRIASYPMPSEQHWPAKRVTWQPDPQRVALLIHDMQAYFLGFYDQSSAPIPDLIGNIQRLRLACEAAGVPVFYTAQPGQQPVQDRALLQDWWGPGITAFPDQSSIIEPLRPSERDTILPKWRYSAFAKSDFRERLTQLGRDQLIVCGIYAHIGVMTTCVDAFMRDVQPFLVADAVADFSREEHEQALKWVAGRCGVVLGTQDLCQRIHPDSGIRLYQSAQALLADVANTMEIPSSDLHIEDNLVDMGLDSLRLMALVSRWRKAGCAVDFPALARVPTVQAWWPLLRSDQPRMAEQERHVVQ